jgi:signal transduction histidine kinase
MLLTHVHQPPGSTPPPDRMSLGELFPWVMRQVMSGKVFTFSKISDFPPQAAIDRENLRRFGTKADVLVPLSSGEGPVFGLLTFAVLREERVWTEAVVTGFKLIANVFAGALVRKRADEELRRHEQELGRLTGRIINAQEEELRRLSRELHDDLTQRLAALALDAALIEKELHPAQPRAVQALRDIRARLTELAGEVHNLSRQLHPSILDDLGLAQAVQAECAAFVRKTGIDLSFTPQDLPETLPQNIALCLYRIIREGLQNIAKHSGAAAAAVELHGLPDGIRLVVKDNGSGFDPETAKQKAGIGLSSMRERVRLVNGAIAIAAQPGQGAEIQVFIPLGDAS